LEAGMSKTEQMTKIAENCLEMARQSENEPSKKRLERLAQGWSAMAKNQHWLDGEKGEPVPPDGN
jgi:hypothetical protein